MAAINLSLIKFGMANKDYIKGSLYVLISALMFGSYGVWSKILGPEFGIYFQGWVRSAIVLVILLPIAYFTNNLRKMDREDYGWLFTTILFGIFTQAPLHYAYIHSGIGISTVIFFAIFLLTSYVISWFFLNEKVTTVKVICLCWH